ncbi:hypothetical protein GCM10027443_12220 [Pontibacter brevis]
MEKLLTYGLSGGALKHISEVENGLACNCVCSKCNHPLVAKNSSTNKKLPHFAHHSGKECDGAYESALHLLAKAVLQKNKQLLLPDYHYDYKPANAYSLHSKGKAATFDEVLLEQQVSVDEGCFIPDAICLIGDKKLFIEFANSHFVDQQKLERIKKLGIACIEIDLTEQTLDEGGLASFLNSDTPMKYWIYNPRLDQDYFKYKRYLVEQEERQMLELSRKYYLYKSDKRYRVLSVFKGNVSGCPKRAEALNTYKSNSYYRHNLLKRVIDGEYWNGKFYGQMPNGKWIFLKRDKVFVFPPDNVALQLPEQERKLNKFVFAGLMNIAEALDKSGAGTCQGCKFSVDYISFENNSYQVCKHPSGQ